MSGESRKTERKQGKLWEQEKRENGKGTEDHKGQPFPLSLFAIYLGVLFLMSGLHVGLVVMMNKLGWNEVVQCAVPMIYWGIVAVGLTLFTRKK